MFINKWLSGSENVVTSTSRWPLPGCLCTITGGAIPVIAWATTYYAENYSDDGRSLNALLKLDVSTTLTVLRASQGLLSTITTLNLRDTFVNTHWVLMSRDDGISYPSLLALSPTTSAAGLIRLLTLPLTKTAWKPHFWTCLR